MKKKVVIVGTLDTKGEEFLFLKERIEQAGAQTFVINTGIIGEPFFKADINNHTVANAAGETINKLKEVNDRGYNIDVMMRGAAEIVSKLYEKGEVSGIVSMGGTAGTTIGTHVMQALPVGLPKLQVSTVASGDTRPYVGAKDITMMYSVVDIAGLNKISKTIISNAAFAIAGMALNNYEDNEKEKVLIGATMFGVTTPCVTAAREYLESKDYEVLVFHATGTGGQSMEALIEGGFIKGVLDLTTTEWCDELVGGVLNAGPHRLEAAGKMGIPQIVSTGALDMVNFGPMDTVPDKFKNRILYKHNPTITLMRTTVEENIELGKIIAEKLNMAKGPTVLMLPLKGVSLYDQQGHSFYGPEQAKALFSTLKKNIDANVVELVEMENAINDEDFALTAAKKLEKLMMQMTE